MTATNTSGLPTGFPGLVRPPSKDAARPNGEGGHHRIGRAGIISETHGRETGLWTGRGELFGTITVGGEGFRTGQQILDALACEKICVGDCAMKILGQLGATHCNGCEERVELVCLRPKDVGFHGGALLREFYEHVQGPKIGLCCCPAETAALLLLSHLCDTIPMGAILLTGMEAIGDIRGEPGILGVACDSNRGRGRGPGLMLRTFGGFPHTIFPASQRFLFVSPAFCG